MQSMAFLSINRSESSVDILASEGNIAVNDLDDYSEDKTVTGDNLTLTLSYQMEKKSLIFGNYNYTRK